MRIAFFEVSSQEREYLESQKCLSGPTFFAEELHKAPASTYRNADVISTFIYSKVTGKVLNNG